MRTFSLSLCLCLSVCLHVCLSVCLSLFFLFRALTSVNVILEQMKICLQMFRTEYLHFQLCTLDWELAIEGDAKMARTINVEGKNILCETQPS